MRIKSWMIIFASYIYTRIKDKEVSSHKHGRD